MPDNLTPLEGLPSAGDLNANKTPSIPAPKNLIDTPAAAPQPAGVLLQPEKRKIPVNRRYFGYAPDIRRLIYENVLTQAQAIKPIENSRYKLALTDLEYSDSDEVSLKQQKEAILGNKSINRRLKGTWSLTDNATGNVLDSKRMTVAQVPHMTDRGTFIINGTEYTLSHQMRLRPGIFTRIKANNEVEAHANVMPGKGVSHRYFFEPETSVFRINVGQSKVPLLPILKAMGTPDNKIREAWGNDIFAINQKHDSPHVVDKLYRKLVRKADPDLPIESKAQALTAEMLKMEMDPEVTKRTLGKPYASLTADAILDTTRKLLAVNKREADPDDRDHLAFQNLMGPEDLIAERIGKDRTTLMKLLWHSTNKGNLSNIQPGSFTNSIMATFRTSGLGQAAEEVNAAELVDHQGRITRLGEGGIGDAQSVPMESRSVHPSQMAFVDPIKTPESFKAGVDLRTAYGVQKGSDGRFYAPFNDPKVPGRKIYKSPQELADLTVAFPGELSSNKPYVQAMIKGKLGFVSRDKIDIELPSMENAFSPLSNMVPMKAAVKGQRVSMGARMLSQALPLLNAQAPLVQSQAPSVYSPVTNEPVSFEQLYGRHMGIVEAKKGGIVTKSDDDGIKVKHDDGEVHTYELYNHHPYNRKTYLHNTNFMKAGERFNKGDLLAKSNYTDDNGTAALGLNARVAYLPFQGKNYEDAIVISESMAKRMTSEHMYQHTADFDNVHKGKKSFISLFPADYDRKTLENMDDNGVIKPGTVVKYGDPLVLMASEKERAHNQVHRGKTPFSNNSIEWKHHVEGVVTDVVHNKNQALVAVKAYMPMQIGDKLSGRYGDKGVTADIIPDDQMPHDAQNRPFEILLSPMGLISRINPAQAIEAALGKIAEKTGKPYKIEDFASPNLTQYALNELKKHKMEDTETVTDPTTGRKIPGVLAGNRFFMKLHHTAESKGQGRGAGGAFTAEGTPAKGGEGGCFAPKQKIRTLDGEMAIAKICEKRLGVQVLAYSDKLEQWVYRPVTDWFIYKAKVEDLLTIKTVGGTGGRGVMYVTKNHVVYTAEGKKLAGELTTDDMLLTPGPVMTEDQEALLLGTLLGDASVTDIGLTAEHSVKQNNYLDWMTGILAGLEPAVYKRPARVNVFANGQRANSTASRIMNISFKHVYKPLRKLCYSGPNETKTVTAEWLSKLNGLSVTAWVLDDGSISNRSKKKGGIAMTGNIAIQGFDDTSRQLLKDWLSDRYSSICHITTNGQLNLSADMCEELIKEIATWIPWDAIPKTKPFLRRQVREIQKTQEVKKLNSTCKLGVVGLYITDIKPYKHDKPGIEEINVYDFTVDECHNYLARQALVSNSKRVSLMDSNALLAHGATDVLRDAHVIRGQKNDDYWLQFMMGHTPPEPKVPFVYEKFINELKGSGINVVREGHKVNVMALTDDDIQRLSEGREITNANTVDWKGGLKPVKGGLFDPGLTGGHGGNRWARIPLNEPMPNPVMEEPIRRMLGLTEANFLDILSGNKELNGQKGPSAIANALKNINIDKEITKAKADIASGKKSTLDAAVRKLQYLESAKRLGIHPEKWIVNSVPVLPPAFRPVSLMSTGRGQMVADPNYLYKEVFDSNQALSDLKGKVDDVSQERLNVYNSFKAVTGLGDPIHPKNVERGVKGILRHIFGTNPKFGTVQFKLLGASVNLVGRGVITPNPDIDMDSIGLPEDKAWDVYQPFVVRGLAQRGIPKLAALQAVKDKTKQAKDMLIDVMKERPVIVNRYPVLHRYGLMAFWPKLVKGDTIHVSPIITKGFGADFDGDTMQYHVPASDDARRDTIEKMLPSKNLFSAASFKVHYVPNQEYIQGLHAASAAREGDKPKRTFATKKDAIAAYRKGEINLGTPVEVLGE